MAGSRIEDILPLTPFAEGLLFHALFDDGGPDVYTVQVSLELEGDLDPERLHTAAAALLRRHPNLRGGFRQRASGDPVQVIEREVTVPWRVVEAPDLDAAAKEAEAERATRFDVTRPPLVRFLLLRLGERSWRLVASNHHLLLDGWSMPLLMRELFALYVGADLPPATPYRTYLTWLAARDRDAARAAWRESLDGVTEATRVTGPDAPLDVVPAERVTVGLPAGLAARLTALAGRHGLTVNTVVQGAWAVLLSTLTGQTDVVFGATVSGRPPELDGVESMVGLFINTVPVRVPLNPARPLLDVLREVQDEQAGLVAHQYLGLTDIHRVTGVPDLFDTIVLLDNHPFDLDGTAIPGTGLRITGMAQRDGAHYPLRLVLIPQGGPALYLDHRPDLFAPAEAAALADRLVRILAGIADDPERPIGTLETISPAERDLVLTTWNATGHEIPDTTLAALLSSQAARTPDAVALVAGPVTLTYAELDARINRLARLLISRGAGPETFVAVALHRSVELVVALHAVVKAGAAYVPVDPALPRERVAYVLGDAAPALVLSSRAVMAELGYDDWLPLDDDPAAAESGKDPAVALNPAHPAYMIYTSGSTGRPKGAVVSHRAIVNRLLWMQDEYGLTADDRVLQKTPYGFDVSVWEFFWPLITGAGLVVLEPDAHMDPARLATSIRENAVTTAHFVPPMLHAFLDEPSAATCTGLRRVICSGEALGGDLARRFAATLDVPLHNLYGPTEAAVDVTYQPYQRSARAEAVPIGRPVWNTRLYVLDARLRPVPPGTAGELYLAGVQLARGYQGRFGLTAERFVADPYGPPGTRMYRTGDVARWRSDGALDFIGRADDQVKVRGFRIELGEIEAVLAAAPGMRRAVVMVREDRPGDRRLVGYLVGDASIDQARAAAEAKLPEYMVPSAFVRVDDLPLNTSGKVDRRALPAPEVTPAGAGRAPRNPHEETLCGLFAEVLGVQRVGVDDDFFALGGHSLLATRLISRIRTVLKVDASLRALFDTRTVARFAPTVAVAGEARPRVRRFPRTDHMPLSYAQRRLWFLGQLDGQSAAYNIPFALRLTGDLDRDALRAALADVATRHESLRTIFPDVDGGPTQRILPSGGVDLPVEKDVLARAEYLFDVTKEVPVRAWLSEVSPTEHVLLVVIHHIAGDGWSTVPLARDLSLAYAARLRGEAPVQEPLPVQYADYTRWQLELLGTESDPDSLISRQLAFWKSALAGLPEKLDLPADRDRPPLASFEGAAVPFVIGSGLHGRLAAVAAEHEVSLFMVVRAGLAVLLHRLGAGTDIPIGTAVAGRTDDALDDLVGFFVNTLVLRTDLTGDPTLAELLNRVRDTDLTAFAHQDVPFERLVEVLNPARSLSWHPLFQVMLTLQNNADARIELPGLTCAVESVPSTTAKFDLFLELTETFDSDGRPAGIDAVLEYATDLFDEATVRTLAERLTRVYTAMADTPTRRIGEVDLLTPDERRHLLDGVNDSARPPTPATLVDAIGTRSDDSTAVICGAESLTYAQLNARSNQLARHLIRHGVGAETFVAVTMPRTADLIVALLGILKAGGAYVPIDPAYPADRISYMRADAAPLLTLQALPDIAGESAADLDLRPDPAHPAYMIYTSGSTGRPKGVVVTHATAADLTTWVADTFDADQLSRVLVSTSLNFDVSVFEIFGTLAAGGSIEVVRDLLTLAEMSEPWTGSLISAVPSALDQLLGDGAIKIRTGTVVLAGEAVPPSLLGRMATTLPGIRLANIYGPTEATVYATAWFTDSPAERAPMGRPIRNRRAYVLDRYLQPVPPGVPGDLYLGGDGLARGYHCRAALTSHRFVADPYGKPGARMYRTGDTVRWRPDGELDFVGRTDDQVKVRGFRIELGEVETALSAVDGVHRAVVVVREDRPGDRRLVGYVVGQADPARVRAAAGATLPEYMVPSVIVPLEALPLLPNGKLDRAALPVPGTANVTAGREPRNATEQTLCELAAEVLGVDRVSIDDNFFDLGGHSLLATRFTNRVRSQLSAELSVRAMFETPTVAGIAAKLSSAEKPRPALRPMRNRRDAS